MPSTLSKNVLSKYPNEIFIETGTSVGDGVALALECGFKKIYTIEINPELVLMNRWKFESYKDRVKVICGDSFQVLKVLLQIIDQPCTFWLDGHWDGGPAGSHRCPLLFELEEIASHHIKNHKILVDDRRLFGDLNHHWGREVTESRVVESLKKINSDYTISYEHGYVPNDIITAVLA